MSEDPIPTQPRPAAQPPLERGLRTRRSVRGRRLNWGKVEPRVVAWATILGLIVTILGLIVATIALLVEMGFIDQVGGKDPVRPVRPLFVDMGNAESERGHMIKNWGETAQYPNGARGLSDKTVRLQPLHEPASVTFPVVPDQAYRLVFEVDDGSQCFDDFAIVIPGVAPRLFVGTKAGVAQRHEVVIPQAAVTNDTLTVTFQNLARDDCGRAGVYYIELEQIAP